MLETKALIDDLDNWLRDHGVTDEILNRLMEGSTDKTYHDYILSGLRVSTELLGIREHKIDEAITGSLVSIGMKTNDPG